MIKYQNCIPNVRDLQTRLVPIFIAFICILGLNCSVFKLGLPKLAKQDIKPCTGFDTILTENELVLWGSDTTGDTGKRRKLYLSKPELFKEHTFYGFSIDCITEKLGQPVAADEEDFNEEGTRKMSYWIYVMHPEKDARDSSISFTLSYYERDRRVYDFELSVSEDPLYDIVGTVLQYSKCREILDSIFISNPNTENIDSITIAGRRNFDHLKKIQMEQSLEHLSQLCIEEKLGRADQYYYHYSYSPHTQSNSGLIFAQYRRTSKYPSRINIMYDIDGRCIALQ